MKKFLDEDFCLKNETSKRLYHTYAKELPIIDYHCHLSPEDIATDKTFKSLAELWLSGDHYKWRLMRADGAEEKFVTGDGDDNEKLRLWASVLEKAIGNPLYHWSHMELKTYFDYEGILKGSNYEEVIEHCKPYFENEKISARKLIEKSKVTHICTTDDPVDDLNGTKCYMRTKALKQRFFPPGDPIEFLTVKRRALVHILPSSQRQQGWILKPLTT